MKILVRGTNWIGDAVMSVPAMRRLRTSFPEASITLLTREWAEGIFRDADFIDDVIKIHSGRSALRSVAEQVSSPRKRAFDLAVVLPNSFDSALAARLARVRRVFGYAANGRRFLLTDPVPVPEWKRQKNEVFYYLNLIEAVERAFDKQSPSTETGYLPLPVNEKRKASARAFLADRGVDLSRSIVALAAGSKNSRAKRWGALKFAELADNLVRRTKASVIIIGAADEADVSAEVVAAASERIFDFTGKTDLAGAASILSVCSLLVSNDMGLAHLAPAGGTPAVVIFGPTNPVTTGPFDPKSVVVKIDVECSPCMLRDCPIDHRCMSGISVETVFRKAAEFLAD